MTRSHHDGDPLPTMHLARPDEYWCGDGMGVPACRSTGSAATSDATHIKGMVDCGACRRTKVFKSEHAYAAHACVQCERKPSARLAVRAGREAPDVPSVKFFVAPSPAGASEGGANPTEAEWALLCSVVRDGALPGKKRESLPRAVSNEALDETWALQDGYGEAGSTPPQGWDWSGIRDSSPAAKRRMVDAVVAILKKHGFQTRAL